MEEKMDITKAYNYKVANDLVSCSGTIKTINLKSLSDTGYEVVINLLPDNDQHARENEKQELENLGIQYFHIPVEWDIPKQSDFIAFESALNSVKGKKLHIHCAANYRVTAFYSSYAYKNLGWSKSKKGEFIASIWDISDYPIWNDFISEI